MEALEAACLRLQAAPNDPQARDALEQFKRRQQILHEAVQVLTSTQHAVVQFHCVVAIREAALTRWRSLSPQERSQPLDALMHFVSQRYSQLPTFVSGSILQTISLLLKRGWLERTQPERDAILDQMGAMLLHGSAGSDQSQLDAATPVSALSTQTVTRLTAAKWMLAFVTEFSSASRSSRMLQPVEFHTKTRKNLEEQGLSKLLSFAVQLLEDLIRSTSVYTNGGEMAASSMQPAAGSVSAIPKEQLDLLETTFQLCIELVNWNFEGAGSNLNLSWSLSGPSNEASGNKQKRMIAASESWRSALVRPALIHAAFNTYAYFRSIGAQNETLLHLSRQFLLQLASLQGSMFVSTVEQTQFLAEIFRGATTIIRNPFLDLVPADDPTACEVAARELIDMSHLFFRLVVNLGLKGLASSSSDIFLPFVEELASLSCKLLSLALEQTKAHQLHHIGENIDELWQLEGFDVLMDAWVALVDNPLLDSSIPASMHGAESNQLNTTAITSALAKYAAPVVDLYLQVQLELAAIEALVEEEEADDVEEPSPMSSLEQIEMAAALARMNASSTSSLLLTLTKSVVSDAQNVIAARGDTRDMPPELSQHFEKLHFLLRFIGLFLADDYRSERPGIPVRILSTFQEQGSADAPSVASILRYVLSDLLELETTRVAQNPSSSLLSPFVGEQLLQTITRICATYMNPENVRDDSNTPIALRQLFRTDNGGHGGELIVFLVQKCTTYLAHWPTQPGVMQNLLECFLVLAKSKAIGSVLNSPTWQSLIQANGAAGSVVTLKEETDALRAAVARVPSQSRGVLTEVLCRASSTADNQEMAQNQFLAVSRPVEARLQSILSIPNLGSTDCVNNVRIQEELKLVLEMYSGIARAAEPGTQGLISAFTLPALPSIVKLFDLFHGDSQLVYLTLTFFCSLADTQISFLSPQEALHMYTACNDLILSYGRHNLRKVSVLGDVEEESFADLLALLQLLSHLVTKDFIDFADYSLEQSGAESASGTVAKVVFSGLSQIIPLMTEQLLQYPSLSSQYFALISYMIEVYAEKLSSLDNQLLGMLLQSLLFGIRHVQVDVARKSFQALGELADFHWKAKQQGKPGLSGPLQANPDMFLHYIRAIYRIVLYEEFNPSILDGCAEALFPLVLIEQDRYYSIAEEFSKEQQDGGNQQRLMAAFASLVQFLSAGDMAMGNVATRKLRNEFKNNLYAFAGDVRGFLQVK